MTFRDDRDALLARNDALQRDLDKAQDQLEETEHESQGLAEKLAEAEQRADAAERLLAEHEQPEQQDSPANKRSVQLAIAALGALIAAGLVIATLPSHKKQDATPEPERPSASPSHIEFSNVSANGGSTDALRSALQNQRNQFNGCFGSSLAVKVHVEATVNRGVLRVADAHQPEAQFPDSGAVECVRRAVRRLYLPPSPTLWTARFTVEL